MSVRSQDINKKNWLSGKQAIDRPDGGFTWAIKKEKKCESKKTKRISCAFGSTV